MPRLKVTSSARKDIEQILQWSRDQFGEMGMARYQRLISIALKDVSVLPKGIGHRHVPDTEEEILIWHLRTSVQSEELREFGIPCKPRHLLVYKVNHDAVVILRVLHEVMDLPRQLP